MRLAARVDGNQEQIVKGLRALGFSVGSMAQLGKGWPDIAVGMLDIKRGLLNYFFEIKDPAQPPSKRKLTGDEMEWHARWRGQVDVIETVEDALRIMKGAGE